MVAWLSLSSWCLVMVVWLLLAVPWVCVRFLIVVFSDHTHSLVKCATQNWFETVVRFNELYLSKYVTR